ncbi:MAG: hypothetical protein JWQ92_856, partial [Amnibacterium sp.]|nr:hypothetical protein [Amnibacterium sp.]
EPDLDPEPGAADPWARPPRSGPLDALPGLGPRGSGRSVPGFRSAQEPGAPDGHRLADRYDHAEAHREAHAEAGPAPHGEHHPVADRDPDRLADPGRRTGRLPDTDPALRAQSASASARATKRGSSSRGAVTDAPRTVAAITSSSAGGK